MAKMNQCERDKKAKWFHDAAGSDGILTASEIRHHLKDMGIELPYTSIIKMFRDLDENGDGKVTFEEFMGAMDSADIQREKLKNFFKKMDKNGDGMLTEAELLAGLNSLPDVEVDMDHAKDLIKACDVDRDGKIDMNEFINAMCR